MLHVLWLAVRAAQFTKEKLRTAFQIFIPIYKIHNVSSECVSLGVRGGTSGRLEDVGGGRLA